MQLTLHTMPGTIGLASHIALQESGLPFDVVHIDFAVGAQLSDDYRQINPKQRVPSLVINDTVLTETPAILNYLAQIAPESPIAIPEEPLDIARINEFNSYLCSTVHVAHAHKMRGHRWTDSEAAKQSLTDYVPVSMTECFDLIESNLLKGPWVHGERFSISDPYLFAITRWLEGDGVSLSRYKTVERHHDAMMNRNSVKAIQGE